MIDKNNIDELIGKLNEYYKHENKNKLATVDYPQYIKYGSNEWLLYIFYSCLLDYGMKSQKYHMNLINTYDKYPQIFEPRYVVDNYMNNEEELINVMKSNIHPRYPNIALKKWLNLSLELIKYDNLLKTVQEFNSFLELNEFVRGIKGYGQKTGGLLIRLIYDAGIIKFNDKLAYIPLDRHDIEISYLNHIIDRTKLNNKQIDDLSRAYIESGEKLGVEANLIDKYLWNIGNDFCNKKDCQNCPLYGKCRTKINN